MRGPGAGTTGTGATGGATAPAAEAVTAAGAGGTKAQRKAGEDRSPEKKVAGEAEVAGERKGGAASPAVAPASRGQGSQSSSSSASRQRPRRAGLKGHGSRAIKGPGHKRVPVGGRRARAPGKQTRQAGLPIACSARSQLDAARLAHERRRRRAAHQRESRGVVHWACHSLRWWVSHREQPASPGDPAGWGYSRRAHCRCLSRCSTALPARRQPGRAAAAVAAAAEALRPAQPADAGGVALGAPAAAAAAVAAAVAALAALQVATAAARQAATAAAAWLVEARQ